MWLMTGERINSHRGRIVSGRALFEINFNDPSHSFNFNYLLFSFRSWRRSYGFWAASGHHLFVHLSRSKHKQTKKKPHTTVCVFVSVFTRMCLDNGINVDYNLENWFKCYLTQKEWRPVPDALRAFLWPNWCFPRWSQTLKRSNPSLFSLEK